MAVWVAYQGAELEERLELVPGAVLLAAWVFEHGAYSILIRDLPCDAAIRLMVPQSRLTDNQIGDGRAVSGQALREGLDYGKRRVISDFVIPLHCVQKN